MAGSLAHRNVYCMQVLGETHVPVSVYQARHGYQSLAFYDLCILAVDVDVGTYIFDAPIGGQEDVCASRFDVEAVSKGTRAARPSLVGEHRIDAL